MTQALQSGQIDYQYLIFIELTLNYYRNDIAAVGPALKRLGIKEAVAKLIAFLNESA